LTITEYQAEYIKDPFGILSGKRYEFLINLDVEEDDELYSENGIYVKVIFKAEEDKSGIVSYQIFERSTDKYLEFDLSEEEEAEIATFCSEHLPEE